MKAKLISRELGEFVFAEQATIGRARGSTVPLESTVVSNEHARISFDAERSVYVLEDLDSLNGTELDGVAVDRKEVLGKLHVISFGGGEDFVFQLLSAEADSESAEPPTMAVAAVSKTQVGGEVPVLPAALRAGDTGGAATGDDPGRGTRIEKDVVPVPEVLAQASADVAARVAKTTGFALDFALGESSKRFPLQLGDNVVGRSKAADIRLDSPDLSRRHATLTVSGGEVFLRDEGSRNHTFVGGEQVERESAVAVGAQIVFGRLEATLVASATGRESEGAGDLSGEKNADGNDE